MASTTTTDHDDDDHHHTFASIGKAGKSSGEIEGMDVRLLNNNRHSENYSPLAAVLPFLFPAFGGLLYGYDIGATSSATINIKVSCILRRRRELMVSAASYIIGAVITTLAPGFAIMVIGRFIYGIGIGLAMHAAPMYIAETAASRIRGRLISLKEFFIVMGMVLGYVIGSLLVDINSGWRYMYGTAI
ncbi:hypothetical protein M8C21_005504, partial [Ambrosia artemisiifolia]